MNRAVRKTDRRSRAESIQLLPMDRDNFGEIISLEVKKEQSQYILGNEVFIAQAYVQDEMIPLAIFDEKKPVGFLIYCINEDDGEYWLQGLMVDGGQQSKGYGETAMRELLDTVQKDPKRKSMFLSVNPHSVEAVNLFHKLGFRFNGQEMGKEQIMLLEW